MIYIYIFILCLLLKYKLWTLSILIHSCVPTPIWLALGKFADPVKSSYSVFETNMIFFSSPLGIMAKVKRLRVLESGRPGIKS